MKKILIALFLLVIFLAGCVPQKYTLYYWGNYSSTLYSYKKEPNEQNLANHIKSIETIMETSQKNQWTFPPGICGEYGYYLALEGRIEEAEKFLNLEIEKYPESATFIQTLKEQMELVKETEHE